ncbi:transglutaminase domain-containing protein [Patescibacteria group bacterium]|nr:transglutaminase domain-containing protein [Patescibacteria group bacterium]
MSFFRRTVAATAVLAAVLLLNTQDARAAGEFEAHSKSIYKVSLEGKTTVTHELTLTNKRANVYATDYALSIGSTRIKNVWAKDAVGFINPNVRTTSNTTTLSFSFNEKAAGLGQTLSFSIGYEDEDVAQQVGRIWEINIPRPEDINEFSTYLVQLSVPAEFKDPVQMTPQPKERSEQEGTITFEFTKDALQKRGITAIFGEKQVLSFNLRYSLENPGPIGKVVKIALPPDTPYQKVLYDSITPEPLKIQIDDDGNWLASFKVDAGQALQIRAAGFAILYLTPQVLAGYNTLPANEYLDQEIPWQVEDPGIQELAAKLKTPENIYNYVVENLSYNYDRIQAGNTRLGAKGALAYPDQAICMEFTDLFVTLARAAGIPARELNGFAYTQNVNLRPLSLRQDILHAWPEYYDNVRKIWIPVDPTWGNTTLGIDYFSRFDLNHFVFVIHGSNPQTPYPAGFYKISGSQGKDITVTPAPEDPEIRTELEVRVGLPQEMRAGFARSGTISITNTGNVAAHDTQVTFWSDGFDILSPTQNPLQAMLPYTTYEVPIRVTSKNLLRKSEATLQIQVAGKTYATKITVKPIYAQAPEYALAVGMGTALAATSTRARGLLLSLRKRRGALRGQSPKSSE